MKQKVVCVLNPFISSHYFSNALAACGIGVVALITDQASARPPRYLRDDFLLVVNLSGELATDVQKITPLFAQFNVLCMLNGVEDYLAYGDQLCAHFFPARGNSPASSAVRESKVNQVNALLKAGVSAPRSVMVESGVPMDVLVQAVSGFSFPLVSKPNIHGGNSVGVHVHADINSLFQSVQVERAENDYAHSIHTYCIQEYVQGQEAIVDVASWAGEHYYGSVGLIFKTQLNDLPVYRYCRMLAIDDPLAQKGFAFTKAALDAVDFRHGLSHTELIFDPEPKLVEINPRISGGDGLVNRQAREMTGRDQVNVFASLLQNRLFEPASASGVTGFYVLYNTRGFSAVDVSAFAENMPAIAKVVFNPKAPAITQGWGLSDRFAMLALEAETQSEFEATVQQIATFEAICL